MSADRPFVPSQPRANLTARFRNFLFGLVPFSVWVGCIFAVFILAKDKARPLDYPGMALVAEYSLVAPTGGSLKELLVSEQTIVAAGALIGRLSGDTLELRAQQVQHAISQLRAELIRDRELQAATFSQARTEQENEAVTDARRFARDVENARLDLLQIQVRLEESRIRLAGLQIDLQRQKGLSAKELFSEAELIRTRTEHDALAERILRTEAVIKGRQDKVTAVEARLSDYRTAKQLEGPNMDLVLGPYAWRISVQQDELELIAMQRERLILRAPVAGRIGRVLARVGERLSQGQIVLNIIDTKPRGMVTYVPETHVSRIRAGMRAIIERSTDPGTIIETRVLSIGPAVVEVPTKMQTVPRVREWRVPVYLQITDEMSPIPGESVRVRILSNKIAGD